MYLIYVPNHITTINRLNNILSNICFNPDEFDPDVVVLDPDVVELD